VIPPCSTHGRRPTSDDRRPTTIRYFDRSPRDVNTLAKRLYNVAPDDVALTFADERTLTLAMHSAEFFQDELEAEGESDDGTTHRIVDGDDDETLLVARETEAGWTVAGEVVDVERA
jgi:hypothetical protein